MAAMDVADYVRCTQVDSTLRQGKELTVTELFALGHTVSEGEQLVRVDTTVSLVAAGAKYVNAFTLPAGAVVRYLAANIVSAVTAGGTSVKVGIGPNGSSTNKYGNSSALTANSKITGLFNVATPLAAQEGVDVCAVVSAGTSLGDTNFSAGSVRVVCEYYVAAALASV